MAGILDVALRPLVLCTRAAYFSLLIGTLFVGLAHRGLHVRQRYLCFIGLGDWAAPQVLEQDEYVGIVALEMLMPTTLEGRTSEPQVNLLLCSAGFGFAAFCVRATG